MLSTKACTGGNNVFLQAEEKKKNGTQTGSLRHSAG